MVNLISFHLFKNLFNLLMSFLSHNLFLYLPQHVGIKLHFLSIILFKYDFRVSEGIPFKFPLLSYLLFLRVAWALPWVKFAEMTSKQSVVFKNLTANFARVKLMRFVYCRSGFWIFFLHRFMFYVLDFFWVRVCFQTIVLSFSFFISITHRLTQRLC